MQCAGRVFFYLRRLHLFLDLSSQEKPPESRRESKRYQERDREERDKLEREREKRNREDREREKREI